MIIKILLLLYQLFASIQLSIWNLYKQMIFFCPLLDIKRGPFSRQ